MALPTPWRIVGSLLTMLDQLNFFWPWRGKASDGAVADAAHSTTSDHYPHRVAALGAGYVVTARDITHNLAQGVDCGPLTEALRRSRDPRLKYVIFNRQIFSNPAYSHASWNWTWRPYEGSDPHTNHAHVSVLDAASADDRRPWALRLQDVPTGGSSVSTLDNDDVLNVASAVIQWATLSGALRPDLAGAQYNLKAVADTLYRKLDALSVAPVNFTAEDVAAALIDDDRFKRLLADAMGDALARVRVIVDPAV